MGEAYYEQEISGALLEAAYIGKAAVLAEVYRQVREALREHLETHDQSWDFSKARIRLRVVHPFDYNKMEIQ